MEWKGTSGLVAAECNFSTQEAALWLSGFERDEFVCVRLYLLWRWSRLQVRALGRAWRGLLRGAEVRRGSLLPRLLLLLAVTPHPLLTIWRHLLKRPITQLEGRY